MDIGNIASIIEPTVTIQNFNVDVTSEHDFEKSVSASMNSRSTPRNNHLSGIGIDGADHFRKGFSGNKHVRYEDLTTLPDEDCILETDNDGDDEEDDDEGTRKVSKKRKGNEKKKRVSMQEAVRMLRDTITDSNEENILTSRKKCWACQTGLLVRNPDDPSKIPPAFDKQICQYVKNCQFKIAPEYLFNEIQHIYETSIRPLYALEKQPDPGPWSIHEITDHFTNHIVEPTMCMISSLMLIRNTLSVIQKTMFYRDKAGDIRVDPVELRSIGYTLEMQRKFINSDTSKSPGFENELSIAPPKNRNKKDTAGPRIRGHTTAQGQ